MSPYDESMAMRFDSSVDLRLLTPFLTLADEHCDA